MRWGAQAAAWWGSMQNMLGWGCQPQAGSFFAVGRQAGKKAPTKRRKGPPAGCAEEAGRRCNAKGNKVSQAEGPKQPKCRLAQARRPRPRWWERAQSKQSERHTAELARGVAQNQAWDWRRLSHNTARAPRLLALARPSTTTLAHPRRPHAQLIATALHRAASHPPCPPNRKPKTRASSWSRLTSTPRRATRYVLVSSSCCCFVLLATRCHGVAPQRQPPRTSASSIAPPSRSLSPSCVCLIACFTRLGFSSCPQPTCCAAPVPKLRVASRPSRARSSPPQLLLACLYYHS